MFKDKRGLSTIVVTLILIVLSLVAVGVVWVVISNLLNTGTQQANFQFGTLFLNLKIDKVLTDSSGNLLVTVNRGTGQGDLKEIDFIVSDGKNSQVIKKPTTLSELGTSTFTLTPSDLGNIGFAKEVDIAPVISSGGQDQVGSKVDSKILSTKEVIQNLGGVSWWRLDGDASDELGNNPGTIVGSLSFVQGRAGQAASFDGTTSKYINTNSGNNLPLGNSPRTMLAWIKPAGYPDPTYNGILVYSGGACTTGSLLSINNVGRLTMAFWCNDAYQAGITVNLNQWNQVAFTYEGGTSVKFYINGALVDTETIGIAATTTNGPIRIGCTDNPGRCFNGQIEDAMIFNQALTANQIQALYNLDLSQN